MNNNKDSVIIIQARMSSRRFPGKMMSLLAGVPLIEYVYKRCVTSSIRNILVATSVETSDNVLYDYCSNNDIPVVRGSLDNVLQRHIQAAESMHAKYIVRVCGDTPFVDVSLIDESLEKLVAKQLDYVSWNRVTCIDSFIAEAICLGALKKAMNADLTLKDRDHVTKFILDNPKQFSIELIESSLDASLLKDLRLTIDYPQDIEIANTVVNELRDKFTFSSQDILNIVSKMNLSNNQVS